MFKNYSHDDVISLRSILIITIAMYFEKSKQLCVNILIEVTLIITIIMYFEFFAKIFDHVNIL